LFAHSPSVSRETPDRLTGTTGDCALYMGCEGERQAGSDLATRRSGGVLDGELHNNFPGLG
jgi:hypothetical protein